MNLYILGHRVQSFVVFKIHCWSCMHTNVYHEFGAPPTILEASTLINAHRQSFDRLRLRIEKLGIAYENSKTKVRCSYTGS